MQPARLHPRHEFVSPSMRLTQVSEPDRTMPRALLLAVLVMLACYVLPLGFGVLADDRCSTILHAACA